MPAFEEPEASQSNTSPSKPRTSSISSGSSSSEDEDPYAPDDGETWQDADPDTDALDEGQFKDLFSDATFPNLASMLDNCKQQHGFDLVATIHRLDLDFLGAVKLINYLRKQPSTISPKDLSITSTSAFNTDEYLKPALEDDALLCNIDSLLDPSELQDTPEQRLADLTAQFEAYKLEVKQVLDERLNSAVDSTPAPSAAAFPTDKGYFDSYGTHHIHQDMLQDTARTYAYRDFIYGNKHLFKDKVVLDVGCGTGILSMFCAKAGAKRVIAVDEADIAHKARRIVAANGLASTISVHKCRLEELVLPDNLTHVDIIVSEWMGYCLLFEAMLDTVLLARDKFLKPETGLIVPSHASLHLAAIEDQDFVDQNYTFWRDVYGFDMSEMMDGPRDEIALSVPAVESLIATSKPPEPSSSPSQPARHLAPSRPFEMINLYTVQPSDLDLKRNFSLAAHKSADSLSAFVIWFDNFFLPGRHDQPAASYLPLDSSSPPLASAQTTATTANGSISSTAILNSQQTSYRTEAGEAVILSTGPYAEKATHWKCGVCIIDEPNDTGSSKTDAGDDEKGDTRRSIKTGDVIHGSISMRKADAVEDRRGLRVKIAWRREAGTSSGDDGKTEKDDVDGKKKRKQEWTMYAR